MNIYTLLDMMASAFPDRVLCQSDDLRVDAGALARRAGAFSRRLQDVRAAAVVYLGGNSVALPISVFSAALAGVPFVPLNYRLSSAQLRDVVVRHEAAAVVAAPDRADQVALASQMVWSPEQVIAETAAESNPEDWPDDPDRVAVLLYTSGTTATPKAAILRHRHLVSYVLGSVEFGEATADDAALVAVPPYHIAGVANLVSNVYLGRRVVYLDRFEPDGWLKLALNERITHAMLVPTMLGRIVDRLEESGTPPPPALRTLAYGGARMPVRVLEKALRLMPNVGFVNAYGLTETSSTVSVLTPEDHQAAMASEDPAVRRRLGSVGRVLPTVQIEIRSETGEVVPPGAPGEIFIRGDQVSGEYVGRPSVTDTDGWFATRDRGFLDAEAYLFIEGRDDDMIIRGGENVAPAEIEEVITGHPAVADCAVLGLSDDEWGQRIAAVVVCRHGEVASATDIQEWVRQRLRGWKTPEIVEFRAELPVTSTGKLLRRALRADLEQVSR